MDVGYTASTHMQLGCNAAREPITDCLYIRSQDGAHPVPRHTSCSSPLGPIDPRCREKRCAPLLWTGEVEDHRDDEHVRRITWGGREPAPPERAHFFRTVRVPEK